MESRDEAGGARFVKRLRVRLQDYKFSVVYRAMKKVGWSWNGVSYAPPPLDENKGYVARNAKETTLYLDQFAVQPIDNLLQLRPSSNSPAIAHDKVEQQQGRRLRNQLVDAVLQMKTESSSDVESTSNSSGNEADSTDSSPERPQLRKRRPERRQNTSASATAVERGSSLHMRKPTKRAKKNQPRNNKTKENDSETTEELDLPSPSDVAAHFQDDNDTRFTKVEKKHQKHFQGWLSLLSMKHSLLFYGVGSKQSLLNDFAESTLEPSGDVLVIDGFDRNVEIDAILDLIEFHHLETSTRRRRDGMDGFRRQDTRSYSTMDAHPVVQRAARLGEAVAKHQLERARPLFLVIHNMDGHGLRNRTIQRALATFVEHSAIAEEVNAVRLAASVDHVNAATLLWDVHTSAAFSWVRTTKSGRNVTVLLCSVLSISYPPMPLL